MAHPSSERYRRIGEKICALSVTNDADSLTEIHADIVNCGTNEASRPEHPDYLHSESIKLWLKFLNKLGEATDMNFDADDVPTMNVPAPPGAVGLRSGISPKEINDPEVRRQYEKSVEQNAKKARSYRFQKEVRSLEKKCSDKVVRLLKLHYSAFPDSRNEIEHLIATTIQNVARQQALGNTVFGKE